MFRNRIAYAERSFGVLNLENFFGASTFRNYRFLMTKTKRTFRSIAEISMNATNAIWIMSSWLYILLAIVDDAVYPSLDPPGILSIMTECRCIRRIVMRNSDFHEIIEFIIVFFTGFCHRHVSQLVWACNLLKNWKVVFETEREPLDVEIIGSANTRKLSFLTLSSLSSRRCKGLAIFSRGSIPTTLLSTWTSGQAESKVLISFSLVRTFMQAVRSHSSTSWNLHCARSTTKWSTTMPFVSFVNCLFLVFLYSLFCHPPPP